MRYLFFLLFAFSQFYVSFAQEKTISIDVENSSVISVLNQLETTFDVRFSYSDEVVFKEKITLQINNETLDEIIKKLNKQTNLNFEFISNRNIIILKKTNELHLNSIQILNEVVLKNYITNGIHKQNDASFNIQPKKLSILPGVTEPDLFQTIQLLPGVISLEETATDIHVRGGSPDQNLILWDGIKIYHSGHLFGTFSAFNPYITNKINFINKGTNARYGDRISSIIDIQTNNEVAKKTSGGFGFNMIEADAFVEIPVIENKFSVLVSARRSFTDFISTNTYLKLSDKVFQNESTNSILKGEKDFYYYDYSFKGNWKISDNNYINFSYLTIENELSTNYSDTEKNTYIEDNFETENKGYSINWEKKWNSRIKHQINAYYSNYTLSLSQKTESENNNTINKNNQVDDTGINFNLDYNINSHQNISIGYQFSNNNIKYNLTNHINNNSLSNNHILNTHSFYTSYHYNNEKLFNLIAGMRTSYYTSLNKLELEPRLNIYRKLSPHLNINFTAERKTQAVSQIDETINSGLSLENQIWTIASPPQIPINESIQISGGITFSKNNWDIEIDTYLKEIEGLTTLNRTFIDIEEYQFNHGESQVFGMDFYIKKRINNYFTWASYTFNNIKNHFEGINESESFSANTDITNHFYWTHEYNYKKFQFALGWRWHTGKPYSKAIEVDQDNHGNNFLVYDGINNYRLPNYNRLDFSTSYNFKISDTFTGKAGISILNLLDKENVLNRKYSLSNSDEVNMIETISNPRVTNLVIRIFW